MPALSLSLLGPFEGTLGGQPLAHFRTRSVQALLVYLVVEREGRYPQQREALTELLWPGMPPESGRKNLRQSLYELRQVIPEVAGRTGNAPVPFLLSDRETIRVNPEAVYELDVVLFAKLVERKGLEELETAAKLYRGDFLSNFYLPESGEFEAWVAGKRAYFRRQALQALERVTEGFLRAQEYPRAEKYAWQQLEVDDLRENGVRQLMVALARRGERSAALAQYESFRVRLFEALGAEPGVETVSLYEQVKTGTLEVEEVPTPLQEPPSTPAFGRGAVETGVEEAAPEATEVPNNLPGEITPFVGREEELEEITRRLVTDPSSRLLTLLGPGGIGKTRLALRAASLLTKKNQGVFADGVNLVPLAPLNSPDSMIPAIAKALNFSFYKEEENPQQQLYDYLRGKRMLLVLDNFEHLIDEDSGRSLLDLLSVAPGVRLLVTSRSRLNLQGEQLFTMHGMKTPGPNETFLPEDHREAFKDYGAIRLFLQSARRVRPGREFTPEDLLQVARICHLVEGMPLGIELAAAWMELLSPAEIAKEIEQSLDFLETDMGGIPERQRSIRAVFESSWKMLSEVERSTIQKLSVFRGNFSREAALEVGGCSLKVLLGLVNKSWLQRGASDRYQIHELLRQYAEGQLRTDRDRWRQANQAHSAYFIALIRDCEKEMHTSNQKQAFDTIASEFDNLRAAWLWLSDQSQLGEITQRILPGLYWFCVTRSMHDELLPLLKNAHYALSLTDPGEENRFHRTILLTAEAWLLADMWYYQALAREKIQQAWNLTKSLASTQRLGIWMVLLGEIYGWEIDLEKGIVILRKQLPSLRKGAEPWILALTLRKLGELNNWNSQRKEAREQLSEALAIYQDIGDDLERAVTMRRLGNLAWHDRSFSEARDLNQQAREIFKKLGNQVQVGYTAHELAEISLQEGNTKQAFQFFEESRQAYLLTGNRRLINHSIHWESLQALRFSDLDHARRLRHQNMALSDEIGQQGEIAWSRWEMGEICRVEKNYNEARKLYKESLELFNKMSFQMGISYYHRGMGDIALAQGDYQEAREHFQIYLAWAGEYREHWHIAYALSGLGRAAMGLGQHSQAWEHLSNALRVAYKEGNRDICMVPLAGLVGLFAARGELEQALELGAFVARFPAAWNETRSQAEAVLEEIAGQLPEEVAEAARGRGRALDFDGAVGFILEKI